jgi:hypothetical protein
MHVLSMWDALYATTIAYTRFFLAVAASACLYWSHVKLTTLKKVFLKAQQQPVGCCKRLGPWQGANWKDSTGACIGSTHPSVPTYYCGPLFVLDWLSLLHLSYRPVGIVLGNCSAMEHVTHCRATMRNGIVPTSALITSNDPSHQTLLHHPSNSMHTFS